MVKIFLVVFVLFLVTHQKSLTQKELEEKMLQFNMSPTVSLLLVYDSENPNTPQLEALINHIADRKKGYFNVIKLDCNTEDEQVSQSFIYCNKEYRKQLPALLFSQPNLNIDSKDGEKGGALASVKPYQGPLDEKSLMNFAVPLMKIFSVELKTSRDLNKFQQSNPKVPKIIYFTDKQKKQKIPPLYRALTAHFRHTIAFAHVFESSQLVKDMNITSFPVFLLNGKQKIDIKSNLTEVIQRLEIIQGQPTKIIIEQPDLSKGIELTSENLQQLVYKVPKHILIHVVGQDGKNHPQWQNCSSKFGKMFDVYETFTLKQTLGVKQTPAIVYFPKSLTKKNVQKTIFSLKDTFQTIYAQLDSIIQDFTLPVSNFIELQKMTSVHIQDDKFVAIYFHDKEIPMAYKVISNQQKYQQDIAFFRMKDPEADVLAQYQITKLPALIVMIGDKQAKMDKPLTEKEKKEGKVGIQLKIALYQGKYQYADLLKFFNSFLVEKKGGKDGSEQHFDYTSGQLQQIKKQQQLQRKCGEGCYLLLVNGDPQNQEKNKNYLSVVQKQSQKSAGSFSYIDGACHPQFLNAFDIQEDELPVFIYLEPKFQKFSRLIGRVESNSLVTFTSKIRMRKGSFRAYNNLAFANKNCKQEHEKQKKMFEKGKEMDVEEAAILEELRAQEEKKREELQKQKGQKTRKKNKKKRPKRQWQKEDEEL